MYINRKNDPPNKSAQVCKSKRAMYASITVQNSDYSFCFMHYSNSSGLIVQLIDSSEVDLIVTRIRKNKKILVN